MYGNLSDFHGLKLKIDGFEMNTFFESTNFQFKNSKVKNSNILFFSSPSKLVTNYGVHCNMIIGTNYRG